MKAVNLVWTVGTKTSAITLSWPTGANGVIHVTKDNYHSGQIVKTSEGLKFYASSPKETEFGAEEIAILITEVEQHLKEAE
jgi:hypothetical protein